MAMNRKVVSGLIFASAISSGAATAAPSADSSTINFTGKVVDVPCTIATASQDQTIDLGSVASSQLTEAGSASTPVPVKITLENCNVGTSSTASFTFTGQSTDTNSQALDNTSASGSDATNVGVEMKDTKGTNVVFDGSTPAGETDISSIESGGSIDVDFTADMISINGNATAGDVTAQTTFTVAYQ